MGSNPKYVKGSNQDFLGSGKIQRWADRPDLYGTGNKQAMRKACARARAMVSIREQSKPPVLSLFHVNWFHLVLQ